MSLYQKLFYTDFTESLLSEKNLLTSMIEVELALVKAQEEAEIIPKGIHERLEAIFNQEEFDLALLREKVAESGNPAAPLVKQLLALSKQTDEEASKYIHLGATSQDIVDTAMMLRLRRFHEWLGLKLNLLSSTLYKLAKTHKHSLMIGRTLMQQARPISFGLKAAKWLQAIDFSRRDFQSDKKYIFRIQLGGAVGSQNQYLTNAVRKNFATLLRLEDSVSWHTERASLASYSSKLAILSGSLGKIAKDVVLMSQTEVGELNEAYAIGRGTSSTMPHKRNPILSTSILANAQRTPFLLGNIIASMPQAHERAAGPWHAEWEPLDEIIRLTSGSVEKCTELIQGLEIHTDKMRQNLEATQGLIYAESLALALAKKYGKEKAHEQLEIACRESKKQGKHLRTIVESMALGFSSKDLDELFDPVNSLGYSLSIIEEIISEYEHIL